MRPTSSLRHPLQRFAFELLALLLLLQGPPLLALEGAAPPLEDRALTQMLDSAERWIGEPWLGVAGEPWLDAVAVLLALGSPGDPRHDVAPPLPPGFEPTRPLTTNRATKDKDATAVALGPGWNLISLPAEPSDPDPAAVFAPIAASVERVYAYDACDPSDPWKLYDPADPAASDLVAIDHRMGLWVESRGNANLPIDGTPLASTDFSLCSGWNLIGYPSAVPRPVPSALAPILGSLVRVFGYDAFEALVPWKVFDIAAPGWANDLAAMVPGRGYWVLVSAAADFDLVNEGAPPEVAIDTPGDLATVTTFSDVVGTVRSPLLQGWTLRVRPVGETGGTVVATGDFPIEDQTLGVLDPTLLQNGLFELELRAVDVLGQTANITRQVVIDGGLKLGVFRLPFFDLELPLLGVPIGVIRTYDSRDKGMGDFGVGWRLSTSDVTVRDNGVQGKGWAGTKTNELIPLFCVVPTRAHLVILRFPDDEIYRFQGLIEPECQQVAPPQVVTIRYLPLPGTRGELEPLDQSADLFVAGSFPGEIDLLDFDTVEAYDPSRYRLTTEDGRQLVVDENHGLESITSVHGHRVTFSANGIEHSSGVGVDFQRDAAGRITAIVDPAGNSIRYAYDGAGDLVRVTDQEGFATQLTYLENHYLHTIIDPDGVEHLAAEYDGDGRWIGSCDGQDRCHRVEHDFDGQREIQTDASGRQRSWTYDLRGNVTSQTDGLGNTTHFRYDDRDNLVEIEDPLGHVTRQTFDGRGRRTSIVTPHGPGDDPADFTSSYTYDARGKLSRVRRPSGAELRFDHDAQGNLIGLRDVEGTTLVGHAYDGQGRLLSETTPFGTTTFGDFDLTGEPRKVTFDDGDSITATFDELGNITELVTPDGSSTTTYDGRGRETLESDDDGTTVEYDYGFHEGWTQLRTENGETTGRRFDGRGAIAEWTWADPAGNPRSFRVERDATGRVIAQVDPAGNRQTLEYDAAGRVHKTVAANGAETQHTYDAAGRVIETLDPLGHRTRFSHRPDGKLSSRTDALGHTWTFDHTPTSRTVVDPLGRDTTFETTAYGLPSRTVLPDGSSEAWEFLFASPLLEAESYPTRHLQRDGIGRDYAYDDRRRLTTATDRGGEVYQYTYDPASGLLGSVVGPGGPIVGHTYDDQGRVASSTLGDGGTRLYTYDLDGFRTTVTRPSGVTIQTTEDRFGQAVDVATSGGESRRLDWDPNGRLGVLEDDLGRHELDFDPLGNLTEIRDASGAVMRYERDLLGRLDELRVTPSAGAQPLVTRYTYDAVGNVVAVEDPLGGVTELTYDGARRLVEQRRPNGVVSRFGYDDLDQIVSVEHLDPQGAVLASLTYERQGVGQPTRITREDGSHRTLEYDTTLRLVRENFFDANDQPLDSVAYTYDAAGNRQTRTDSTGTSTSTYLSGDRLGAVVGGSSGGDDFTWDADGRVSHLVRDGEARRFEHDPWDRLTAVDTDDGDSIVRYAYDGMGQRIVATEASGAVRRRVVGPGLGELTLPHAVVDGGDTLVGGFAYLGTLPLMRFEAGTPTYYLTDAMGSVIALTDGNGEATAHFDYDGFGNPLGGSTVPASSLGGDYRFHGAWLEEATGLYHLRARDYDARTGRFLSRDPADPDRFVPETFHTYNFANGNPHLFTDPTGGFSIGTVSFSISIQGSLRAGNATSQLALQNYLRRELRGIITEQVLGFVGRFMAENVLSNFDPRDLGRRHGLAFEDLVFDAVCPLLPEPLGRRLWREPRLRTSDGQRRWRGTNCATLETSGTAATPTQFAGDPSPDFVLTTDVEGRLNTTAFLIGDMKLSVDLAASLWRTGGGKRNQWKAMQRHARNHQHPPNAVMLVALFNGSKASQRLLRKISRKPRSERVHLMVLRFTRARFPNWGAL